MKYMDVLTALPKACIQRKFDSLSIPGTSLEWVDA